jgi:small GTP-binding protein
MEMKKCENDIQYQISIWDTAGQERFRSLAKSHFQKAVFNLTNFEDGVLLVFDLSKPESLSGIINWLHDISENTARDLPLVLIGNKCDRKDKGYEKGLDSMLEKVGMKNYYIECSAKTGENIPKIFDFILREVIKDY